MSVESRHDEAFPVVVIGAGLAGLTAAIHLAERGVEPLVLEADSLWPGGRLSGGEADTFEYAGQQWSFKPDHGVHALWGGYYNLRATFDRFLDIELQPSFGEEWINRYGREVTMIEAGNAIRSRWLPAPFHYLQLLFHPQIWNTITPLDFLSLPGFLVSILWAVGFDPLQEKIALDGLMMNEYFRGWTPRLKATFVGLGENLLAAPAESISLTAFIAALRFYTMLRRDSWSLLYFSGNTHDTLIQPLIDQTECRGGMVMRGATAQKLERMNGYWRISVEDSRLGGIRSLLAEHVILAVQPPAAERLLCASPHTVEDASKMIFPTGLPNATVRLWYDEAPRPGPQGGMFTGEFVPDNFFWLHRLYPEFEQWYEATGGSAIELHIYGPPAVLQQPDQNLLILSVNEVQRAFPNLRGHFIHGTVRRNSANHPQFRIPTIASLHVETPWPDVFTCGDWIGYPTPSMWMERACVTGIAAANNVLRSYEKEPFAIIQPPPPEMLARILGVGIRFLRRTIGRVILRFFRMLRWR
jgi:hypothetical protein